MARDAIHYLRSMPHTGMQDALIEACEALGFNVQPETSGASIWHNRILVAEVNDNEFKLRYAALDQLDGSMPVVTPEQGQAFDRALVKIEWDQVAIHEAGHVVAAHKLGLTICFARLGAESAMQLCADDDVDSLTYTEDEVEKVERLQQAYAAGAAGERVVFGVYRPHGVCKDRRDVNEMETLKVQGQTGNAEGTSDVFDDYVQRVERQLSIGELLAVASALKEKRFLSRQELQSVLQRAD